MRQTVAQRGQTLTRTRSWKGLTAEAVKRDRRAIAFLPQRCCLDSSSAICDLRIPANANSPSAMFTRSARPWGETQLRQLLDSCFSECAGKRGLTNAPPLGADPLGGGVSRLVAPHGVSALDLLFSEGTRRTSRGRRSADSPLANARLIQPKAESNQAIACRGEDRIRTGV